MEKLPFYKQYICSEVNIAVMGVVDTFGLNVFGINIINTVTYSFLLFRTKFYFTLTKEGKNQL